MVSSPSGYPQSASGGRGTGRSRASRSVELIDHGRYVSAHDRLAVAVDRGIEASMAHQVAAGRVEERRFGNEFRGQQRIQGTVYLFFPPRLRLLRAGFRGAGCPSFEPCATASRSKARRQLGILSLENLEKNRYAVP